MMTYLTWSRFGKTASDLSDPMLVQQMDESMQIFDMLTGVVAETPHPGLEMWRGYEFALGIQAMMLNMEFTFNRGFANHDCFRFFYSAIKEMQGDDPEFIYECPPWLGDRAVYLSHRSNLVRRAEDNKWKTCPEKWPYIWPRIDDTRKEGYSLWLSKIDKTLLKEGRRNLPSKEIMDRVINYP